MLGFPSPCSLFCLELCAVRKVPGALEESCPRRHERDLSHQVIPGCGMKLVCSCDTAETCRLASSCLQSHGAEARPLPLLRSTEEGW